MRLGLWNRLAIVSAAAYILLGSTWHVISANEAAFQDRVREYNFCISPPAKPLPPLRSDVIVELHKVCGKLLESQLGVLGWSDWFSLVATYAFRALLLYGLILAAVWIGRWIWRGRSQTA